VKALVARGCLLAALAAASGSYAGTSASEPYGGCKEAARYPNSQGWRECRRAATFRHFGRNWQSVGTLAGMDDALAESGAPRATTRNWNRCALRWGRYSNLVVCPDGTVLRWQG
jgi:hypothetical protein